MKLQNEYRYFMYYGAPSHEWVCKGDEGAVHLHITKSSVSDYAYHGGLERHRRHGDGPPDFPDCEILGGPCWHDGTSLYAEEVLIPFWLEAPHDHERMFRRMEEEYIKQFVRKD